MTVSRVLRGMPHVSAKTRGRVLAAKEKVGYVPNPLVSALMAKIRRGSATDSDQIIAFVTAFSEADGWRDFPSVVRMREGAERRALELGCCLENFWVGQGGLSPARLSRILYTRNIRAVLVAPTPNQDFALPLDWQHFSAASFEYSLVNPLLHRVCTDRFEAVRIACRILRSRGYRRPGLVLKRSEDDRNNDLWSAGALIESFLNHTGKPVPPLLMAEYDKVAFQKWLVRHSPDCVMGINHHLISWIKETGRAVPQDCGFVHLNLTPSLFREISGIDGCIEATGRSAVDIVIGQMHRNEWGVPVSPRLVVTSGQWMEGRTLPAEPGKIPAKK